MRADSLIIDDTNFDPEDGLYLYEGSGQSPWGDERKSDRITTLSFALGDEWYAVDAHCVREVLDLQPITRLPHVPDYVLGIANVRGDVTSVVDVLRLMRIGQTEMGAGSRLVVVEAAAVTMGIVVDAVGTVSSIPIENIQPTLSTVPEKNAAFSRGQVKLGDGTIITLLDIEQVVLADRRMRLE